MEGNTADAHDRPLQTATCYAVPPSDRNVLNLLSSSDGGGKFFEQVFMASPVPFVITSISGLRFPLRGACSNGKCNKHTSNRSEMRNQASHKHYEMKMPRRTHPSESIASPRALRNNGGRLKERPMDRTQCTWAHDNPHG
jgi:hypothetical protein